MGERTAIVRPMQASAGIRTAIERAGGGSDIAPLPQRWGVVHAHLHREHVAIEHLARQEFETYCPMIMRQVRHARRTRDVLRPLFPGYLFVRIDPDRRRWRSILSTRGVRALMRCGERPGFVEDAFVGCLKAREHNGVIVRPAAPYRVGQQIHICSGAFSGLVATIVEMPEKERLVVLMNLLSHSIKVHVGTARVLAI